MSLAVVLSRGCEGMHAPSVTVEVHLANGLPSMSIVGLPEKAVRESKDRVKSAILNSQFDFPSKRITINLAPADLPKYGGSFDLPIALGILAASKQIPLESLQNREFAGELTLAGKLLAFQGALPIALAVKKAKRSLFIPQANAAETALISDLEVFAAGHLLEITAHLHQRKLLSASQPPAIASNVASLLDIADVRGQAQAKRALSIAACGRHSLLLIGMPGSGKSMLAQRLPSIMPALDDSHALEVAAIHSLSKQAFNPKTWRQPPFRSPHHSASSVAIVGGGNPPRPGEISLAHQGVLFLDELPEFNRQVLEALREPLEAGHVTISRANRQAEFPANFQFIAAMNPCPCGYAGSEKCRCSNERIQRYQHKLSGPLLDRIDMQIYVQQPDQALLLAASNVNKQVNSDTIRQQVMAGQQRQIKRQGKLNSQLAVKDIMQFAKLEDTAQQLLAKSMQQLAISARAYHRIIKLARSIADYEGSINIGNQHIAEALQMRRLDQKLA